MLNEKNNEDVLPALLSEGEAVIPETFNLDAVKNLVEDYVARVDQAEETEEVTVEETAKEEVKVEEVVKPVKAETKKKAKPEEDSEKIIAVFSTKNVTWNGVGKVNRGYNIVTQEEADKWATRSHIRVATPQEVAKEYGL
jgi:hypothetical protein